MLVLSRKRGEKITLLVAGKTIVVSVAALHGSRVSIGIDAEQAVRVIRSELQGDSKQCESP